MQQYPNQQSPYGAAPTHQVLTQQDFLSRVSHVRNEIRSLTADVQRIGSLHQQALGGSDEHAQRRLDDLVAQTQLKNTSIRDQIKSLQRDAEKTTDGSASMKKRQWEALNGDFKKELQNYLQEESQFRERYRDQIARQYRIVNPDATEDEIRQASDMDWGNEGVFQTAVSRVRDELAHFPRVSVARESIDDSASHSCEPTAPAKQMRYLATCAPGTTNCWASRKP